jgi:hypothetical protein
MRRQYGQPQNRQQILRGYEGMSSTVVKGTQFGRNEVGIGGLGKHDSHCRNDRTDGVFPGEMDHPTAP